MLVSNLTFYIQIKTIKLFIIKKLLIILEKFFKCKVFLARFG